MRNFSPAPWKFITTEDGDEKVVMDGAHEVFIGNVEDTCSRCYDNARLIEQAPLMYELLMDIYSDIPVGGDLPERIEEIRKRVENWPS